MGRFSQIWGNVQFQIVSADLMGLQSHLLSKGILLRDIRRTDELTVRFSIPWHHRNAVKQIAAQRGERCLEINKTGFICKLESVKKRYALITGMLLLLFLTFYIPSRVFFVEVHGNQKIDSAAVLEAAASNGLHLGMARKSVQSEEIKNGMLEDLPELEWIGVTTSGCVAAVEVREKKHMKTDIIEDKTASIVASTDGVIESISVLKGTAMCKPGQAVCTGQILISGYEDHGRFLTAGRAEGEIYAYTLRRIEMKIPSEMCSRVFKSHTTVTRILQIGKKQIIFSKDSGISPTTCVRIYEKNDWILPGGFHLPIAWITEQSISCDVMTEKIADDELKWAENMALQYIKDSMLAGQVLKEDVSIAFEDGLYILYGEYTCREQIGKLRAEEKLNDAG